ncbi:histidine phosphatase family protein [Cytophagaceae bacterium ABcell3]|nr:histidine phosphatase family protein [Cytophagaceae bacterium ABcell3]
MKSKKIYLIRHGQTDFNLKGIVQGGRVDTDLNETGRKQAKAFFDQYKHIPFKKIYTSALKRTVQSVQHFLDLGIPHECHAGLNEISWGDKDGKIVTSEDTKYYWTMLEAWGRGELDQCIEGGESPIDVQKRLRKVMDVIASRSDEDVILICMHGRAIRILLATLLNYELKFMDMYPHTNLGLYILEYSGSNYSLALKNDSTHLDDLNVDKI